MKTLRKYLRYETFTEIDDRVIHNPTFNELSEIIGKLDGEDVSLLEININDGFMFLRRTSNEFIRVTFSDGKVVSGILADSNENSDEMEYVYGSNRGERMEDLEYKEYSVPEKEAMRVATHYLKTGYLPTASEGYEWQGNVEAFIKD